MRVDATSALVAGGASGLGEATVRKLHAAGASGTLADPHSERGAALAAELGERAGFCQTDVADGDSVQAAVDVAAAGPGGLRIAVCCAGIGWGERVAGRRGPHTLQPVETVIKGDLMGPFHLL